MYQIKIYNKLHIPKTNINLDIVKNKISFTKQINWGLWQFSLLLDLKFDYDFIQWDLVEIYNFENKITNLIYVWYIEQIINKITDFQELELKINWLASLFKRIIYYVGWNYSANINQDTYTTINDIKNFVNTFYNYFSIDWILTWIIWNYILDFNNCFDLINNIKDLSENYYWYLDNYILRFKEKPTIATHIFTLQKDIIELNIEEDATDIVNFLILTYKTWTAIYTDTTSLSIYWRREKYIKNSQIADLNTANDFWNNYIIENKNPKQKIQLNINNEKYQNAYNIIPWNSCNVKNIDKVLNYNLLITKINYTQETTLLELEAFENFVQLIKQ